MCKCNLSPREDVNDINDRNLHHQLLKEGKCKAVKCKYIQLIVIRWVRGGLSFSDINKEESIVSSYVQVQFISSGRCE